MSLTSYPGSGVKRRVLLVKHILTDKMQYRLARIVMNVQLSFTTNAPRKRSLSCVTVYNMSEIGVAMSAI